MKTGTSTEAACTETLVPGGGSQTLSPSAAGDLAKASVADNTLTQV